MNKLKTNGVDLSNRGPAVQDAVWSTGVQYGGNTNVISNALQGKDVSNLSDEQIIDLIQNQKIKRTNAKVKNSRQKKSLLNRIENKRKSLKKLKQERIS